MPRASACACARCVEANTSPSAMGWERVELRLVVPDQSLRPRAAALLGPLGPGRVGEEIRFVVSRRSGVGPDAATRLLANLDEAGISGTIVLVESSARAPVVEAAE